MIFRITILWLVFFLNAGLLHADDASLPLSRLLILDIARAGNHIVAVGERGHILLSEDHQTWQIIQTPATVTLTAVYFSDDQHGWAVGHDAVILKTVDGGRHWRRVYQEAEQALLDIWFADNLCGIAIGAYGLYLTTADGGDTWKPAELSITQPEIQHTESESPDELIESSDLHLNAITRAKTGKLYVVAEAGHLYRSDDQGKTWLVLPSPYNGSFFGSLPLEQDALLVFGLRGHLYRSDDAGESWTRIETHTHELLMNGIRLDSGEIIIVGMGGVILSSRDDGMTFKLQTRESRHGQSAIIENKNRVVMIAGDHGIEISGAPGLLQKHD